MNLELCNLNIFVMKYRLSKGQKKMILINSIQSNTEINKYATIILKYQYNTL